MPLPLRVEPLLPAKKTRKAPRNPNRSKTCSNSTNSPSKSATSWCRWSMLRRADSSWPASNRCAAISLCNSASSFRPFISRTTCASSPANTSFRCAASRSPAGRCSRTRSWPSAPNSRRPRWPERPPASPPSASPRSGFRARSSRRRLPPAMPSWTRLRCSPPILPRSSASTPTNC